MYPNRAEKHLNIPLKEDLDAENGLFRAYINKKNALPRTGRAQILQTSV